MVAAAILPRENLSRRSLTELSSSPLALLGNAVRVRAMARRHTPGESQ